MKKLKKTILFSFIVSLSVFEFGFSQLSLVPANHDVYDWLHQQRVSGSIRAFQYEDLPISRGEIVNYLKEIENANDMLSRSDEATLAAFLAEFDPAKLEDAYKTGIFTGERPIVDRFKEAFSFIYEPHVFVVYDSTNNINAAFDIMFGRAHVFASEDGSPLSSTYYYKGVRAYASIQNMIGFHFEADNVSTTGDIELIRRDLFWGPTETISRQRLSATYSYEAFATLKKDMLSFDIGRGSLRIGPGISSSLLLRETAPNFNWLRLKVSGSRVKYTAIHGSLYAAPFDDVVRVGQDTVRTRVAPERWIVLHRISVRPFERLQISFTEMLTYSNRDPDLAYLNPVAPVFFSELENSDRDNAFMAVDIVAQPIDRIELFASVLIDDLVNFKQIIKDEGARNDDIAVNFGAIAALPFASQLGIEYTRIEPFVYTHWQRLNTFEQRDQSLGHYLGPNADQFEIRIKKWLPLRAWVQASFRNIRKGFNPIDFENNETQNVGGNLLNGAGNAGFRMFQDSDLNKWREFELSFKVEPRRGIEFSANILDRNILDGDRENNYLVGDFRLEIGF